MAFAATAWSIRYDAKRWYGERLTKGFSCSATALRGRTRFHTSALRRDTHNGENPVRETGVDRSSRYDHASRYDQKTSLWPLSHTPSVSKRRRSRRWAEANPAWTIRQEQSTVLYTEPVDSDSVSFFYDPPEGAWEVCGDDDFLVSSATVWELQPLAAPMLEASDRIPSEPLPWSEDDPLFHRIAEWINEDRRLSEQEEELGADDVILGEEYDPLDNLRDHRVDGAFFYDPQLGDYQILDAAGRVVESNNRKAEEERTSNLIRQLRDIVIDDWSSVDICEDERHDTSKIAGMDFQP